MAEDVVILVPGLFGFDAFGSPPLISYFDQVALRLATYTNLRLNQIVVHRPPPTGALCWRVRGLFEFAHGILKDGCPGVPKVRKIHFIGHSTGGLDVRLLLNERYTWPSPPSADERGRLLSSVGTAISISAPHGGTPIARRLRGAMENAIPLFYLLSIWGKNKGRDIHVRQMIEMVSMALLEVFTKNTSKVAVHALTRALPPSLVGDVTRFLDNVIDDHALIHDLTPIAMRRLNDLISSADRFPIRCYVTVSPAPTVFGVLKPGRPGEKLQQFVYTVAYESTNPAKSEGAPFPQGPWVGGGGQAALSTRQANDAVVPCAAQVIGQQPPAGIIAGDHLDVVGHFESKVFQGTSVFRSGSSFDDARFEALWRSAASDLTCEFTSPLAAQ